MTSSKRVASRYLQAKSMYDDLGIEGGPDAVIERAKIRRVDYEPYWENYKKKSKPPSEFERRVYPVLDGVDFFFQLPHGMSLMDGSAWGGSQTLSVDVTLTSHAQLRMDERYVVLPQIKKAIKALVKKLILAWETKSTSEYRRLFSFLNEGTEGQEFSIGGIKLALANTKPQPTKTVQLGSAYAPVPLGSHFSLSLIMVYQTVPLKREDLLQAQCVATLEELGYTLTPKSKWASLRQASSLTFSSPPKPLFLDYMASSALQANQFRINIQHGPSTNPEEVLSALYPRIQNAIDAISKKDLAKYEDAMYFLFNGGHMSKPGGGVINLKTKTLAHKVKLRNSRGFVYPFGYDNKDGRVLEFNLEVLEPATPAPVAPPSAPKPAVHSVSFNRPTNNVVVRETPEEQRVRVCINALKDTYTITPPSDKGAR